MMIRFVSSLLVLLSLSTGLLAFPQTSSLKSVAAKGHSDANAVANKQDEKESKLNQWIRQLDSPVFGERQQAAEAIWKMGQEIVPRLREVVASQKGDSQHRLQELLHLFEMGVDDEMSPEVANWVILFSNGDSAVRGNVVDLLVVDERYGLLFDLLERLPDKEEASQLIDYHIYVSDVLLQLGRNDKWEKFRRVLSSPLIKDNNQYKAISTYQALRTGSVSQELSTLKKKVETKKATDEEIARLIQLLRIRGDLAGAKAYAKKITSKSLRKILLREIDVYSGKFDQLTDHLLEDASESTRLSLSAVQSFLTGDQTKLAQQTKKIVERLKSFKGRVNYESQDEYDVLVKSLFSTLQFSEAIPYFKPEEPADKFRLLSAYGRYDEAFKSIRLKNSVEDRLQWFSRKIRSLKSTDLRYIRTEDYSVGYRSEELFEQISSAAQVIGELGFREESAYYFRTLANQTEFGFEESAERRSSAVAHLVKLEAYDDLWQVARDRFRESEEEYWNLTDDLFQDKMPTADFWFKHLESTHPEMIPRLKLIARLINSPLGDVVPPVDVDEFVSTVNFTESSEDAMYSPMEISFHVGMTYYYQGRQEEFLTFLRRAANLGHYSAFELLGNLEYEKENYQAAFQYYEESWRSWESPFNALRAADCLERLGRDSEAEDRRMIAMLAFVDQGETAEMVENFIEYGLGNDLEQMMRVAMYTSSANGETSTTYLPHLANLVREKSPREAATFRKIYLYELAKESFLYYEVRQIIEMPLAAARFDALALVNEGKTDLAAEWVRKCFAFRRADSQTGELVLPHFDRVGANDLGDELFAELEASCGEILGLYPDSPLFLNRYAWICATNKRRLEFAREAANLAVTLRPHTAAYLDTLAEIEFQLGRKERAIELMKKCVQMDPNRRYYRMQLKKYSNDLIEGP